MEFPYPHDRTSRPQGFRPNLFQSHSPSRVSTDPQPRSSKKSHLHGLHHHQHHRHRHSRHAKEAVQSAIQLNPPTSFGNLLKPASRSKDTTPSQSRRESNARDLDGDDSKERIQRPKTVRPSDVEKKRIQVKAQEEELRSSLQKVSEQSLRTSRNLDDTYYSVLEKLSVLRQTIGSLQELSGLTKELHENFELDTKELVEDVQGQFEGFYNFTAQQEQVSGLEERIKTGKSKAEALTARLEEAKQRVEARAKIEAGWEARTSRRLRVLWSILGTLALFVVLAILFQQLKPMQPHHSKSTLNFEARRVLTDIADAPIPESAKEAITAAWKARPTQHIAPTSTSTDAEDDKLLRMFEEL